MTEGPETSHASNGWGLDCRHREGLGRIQEGGGRLTGSWSFTGSSVAHGRDDFSNELGTHLGEPPPFFCMKSEENVVRFCCFSFHRTPSFLWWVLLGTSAIVGKGYSHGGMGHGLTNGSGGSYRSTSLSILKRCIVCGAHGSPWLVIVEVLGLVREKTSLLRYL